MVEGRDFIFTGLQPWDLPIGSNARDIACEVSKHNRVLYVNTPLVYLEGRGSERQDVVRRRLVAAKRDTPLRKINDNLYVLDMPFRVLPVNALPDGRLFDIANKLNNRRIFNYVKKVADSLGFSDLVHFIDNDIYRSYYSKEYLWPALSIYYRRDNVLASDYWQRHGRRLEPGLVAKSDMVVGNSSYLADWAREYNPLSADIGQGVDLSCYDNVTSDVKPVPGLGNVPRPIIGYLGHLTAARLDPDLVYALAQRNPAVSFVMTGSEDDVFLSHGLHRLANVVFTGPVSPDMVPWYINVFDICINPQKVNETTVGNYPRKIDEYLALGKPVVATRTPAMEMFSNYVALCDTQDDYQAAFDRILSGWRPAAADECVRFAHTHTWEASVSALYATIREFYRHGRK